MAPIYATIKRHRAAWGADDVRYGLAATPCANDAALPAQLRHLHAYEKRLIPGQPFEIDCHGSIPVAHDVHFNPEA